MSGFIRKIPGFRSNQKLNKIIAVIGYFFIIALIMSPFIDDEVEPDAAPEPEPESAVEVADMVDELLDDATRYLDTQDWSRAARILDLALDEWQDGEYKMTREEAEDLLMYARDGMVTPEHEKALEALQEYDPTAAERYIGLIADLHPEYEALDDLRERLAEVEDVLERAGPRPENSPWDAAVPEVIDYLKGVLHDPQSAQYDEWSNPVLMDLDDEAYWAVRSVFRAKNLFGAYVRHEMVFYIRYGEVVYVEEVD